MNCVKTKTLFALSLLICLVSNAQLKLPVTNNDLRNNLEKVVSEFPKYFANIKSAVNNENPQTIEYTSNLKFQGAEENLITEYKGVKPIFTWQATLLTTEDFETASKKYKWLCNQLKVMTLTIDNDYSFSLDGKYDPPVESKAFSSSIYTLLPSASYLPKLRIEAGIQFQFPEWKVQLLVYNKEREDEERGPIKE
jgi:hypothetical protein